MPINRQALARRLTDGEATVPQQRPSPLDYAARLLGDAFRGTVEAKKGQFQRMTTDPAQEMALIQAARGGSKEASDEFVRQTMASPFMGLGVGNIKAYHGTPHAFTKFSIKHIGKGEGAQAYGHGLYFAENPKTAQTYRMSGNARFNRVTGGAMTPKQEFAFDLADGGRSEFDIIKSMARKYGTSMDFDEAQKLAKEALSKRGRLYEVNIKADPPDFLDWDAPLSQQSEKVRGALAKTGVRPGWQVVGEGGNPLLGEVWHLRGGAMLAKEKLRKQGIFAKVAEVEGNWRGDAIYRHAAIGKEKAADVLRKAGIRGIKYKDAGSRGKEGGTSNYVVFDDADVEILGTK